jgi:hypothetical protein
MATMLPFPFADSLTLDPNDPMYDTMAARNKAGFGFLPALKLGLTEEAEVLNGRLAMLGLSMLVLTTALTGQSMIEVVNDWVGGAYF